MPSDPIRAGTVRHWVRIAAMGAVAAYAFGGTAKAYDASTVRSNPAGMVRLNQSEIDGSINGFFPNSTFAVANFFGSAPTTPGSPGGKVQESAATAGIYGIWSVSPDFLRLQEGIGYDQSPVTDSNRTCGIPDSDRYLISIGLQYGFMQNLTLQAAYSHIFFTSVELTSQASNTLGVLVGNDTNSADTGQPGREIPLLNQKSDAGRMVTGRRA